MQLDGFCSANHSVLNKSPKSKMVIEQRKQSNEGNVGEESQQRHGARMDFMLLGVLYSPFEAF